MTERPHINPGDWIRVGSLDCVVSMVRPPDHSFGDCEVVFDPSKPTNRDVEWTGDAWRFVETGDFGGYADKYERLSAYVQTLKRGRY